MNRTFGDHFGHGPRSHGGWTHLIPIVALAWTGCVAPRLPTITERTAAAHAGEAHFGGKLRALEDSVFFVFSSDSSLEPAFEATGDRFKVSGHGNRLDVGLACGISTDGYVLTVAHVIGKYNWVVGHVHGQVVFGPARVVAKRTYGPQGAEFAILRIGPGVDHPLEFAADPGVRSPIFIVGRAGETSIQALQGSVVRTAPVSGTRDCLVEYADCPTWEGDSGAPVVDASGRLIGVNVGWARMAPFMWPHRIVCCPSAAVIRQIVADDRKVRSAATAF